MRSVNCNKNKWKPDETTILLEEKIMTHKFNDCTESLFTSPFSRESNQGAFSRTQDAFEKNHGALTMSHSSFL